MRFKRDLSRRRSAAGKGEYSGKIFSLNKA